MSQHQFYISWCLLLLLALLASCDHQPEPRTEHVPSAMPDSVQIGYGAHYITVPCHPIDSLNKGRVTTQYIQLSTRLRLDTIPVDPGMQIIPLAIGNAWHYRSYLVPAEEDSDMKAPDKFRRLVLSYSNTGSSTIEIVLNDLADFAPDSLRDTLTLPLTAPRVNTIAQSDTGRISTANSSNRAWKLTEDYYGTRCWFLSTAMGWAKWYRNTVRYGYYVYSSDPQGVVIGMRMLSPFDSASRTARDTVRLVGFLRNTPSIFDDCGNRTEWNGTTTITTPAGTFFTHMLGARLNETDTNYYANGIGMVRAHRYTICDSCRRSRMSRMLFTMSHYYLELDHATLQHRKKQP